MKILFISPYNPYPPNYGAATRTFQLLKHVASNHEVTLVFPGSESDVAILREHIPELRKIEAVPTFRSKRFRRFRQFINLFQRRSFYFSNNDNSRFRNRIWEISTQDRYDLVHAEFPGMADFNVMGNPLRVLNAHNVEFQNFKRIYQKSSPGLRKWFYYHEYKKAEAEEIRISKKQDIILTTSDHDQKQLAERVPEVDYHVIPNGVDTHFFTPASGPVERHTLVFTGMMGYVPNNDGMIYFLRQIFPAIQQQIPDVKLYIVGMSPTRELLSYQSNNVVITGKVEDVRPYIQKASVYIVPLRMGSGTRLKILEALAMKKPVVTTTVGCEGLDVEHGKSALIEDEPKAFADTVVDLLNQPVLRRELAETGYQLVCGQYDWSAIGGNLNAIYERIQNKTGGTEADDRQVNKLSDEPHGSNVQVSSGNIDTEVG